MPQIIDVTAMVSCGPDTIGGGGGGCQPDCIGVGGLYGVGADCWLKPPRLSVGCSLGLTLGGIGGAIIVRGGSGRKADVSTSVVPSCVQKLSQSSSKVWLQVGQRFILSSKAFV